MLESKETAILQIAEDMVRQGGYNSFSFRKIAEQVGIKSASVHYHFSTKEELGVAVAKRYTDNFINSIGQPENIHSSGKNTINLYIAAFRSALLENKGMCLCGVLGAEADILPESVVAETRRFFTRNVEWLQRAYQCLGYESPAKAKAKAIQTVSLLEGAMIISNVMDDDMYFDVASELLEHN